MPAPILGAAAILGGASLLSGIIGGTTGYYAMKKQEAQARQQNAMSGLQYQQEFAEGKRRWDYTAQKSEEATNYQKYLDRQQAIKDFGANLQNLMNSDRNAAFAIANLWGRRM